METPYVYYDNKLGVRTKYLVADKNKHEDSLNLINYRALRCRLTSQTSPEKELRRASWSISALVQFNSLSKEWKEELIMKFGSPPEKIKKSYFSQNYTPDRKAFDIYVAHRYGNNQSLDLKLVDKYVYQASVLNTVLKIKNDRRTYAKALGVKSLDIWQSLSNDVNAFREIDHGLPTTKDSLRRKTTKYAKEGYKSLISGKLQNSNASKISNKGQMALLDELISYHTNLDNQLICDLYNTVANQMDWATITAKTVANRKVKSNLVTFAGRNGKRKLADNLLMQVKREGPSRAMKYWTLDGWDAELLYQKQTTNKKGDSVITYHNRLNIVVILDAYKKYPIGYAIGTHETSELNKQAMQNAFEHTKELFGDYYRPSQIQSDKYGNGALADFFTNCSKDYYTSTSNPKAKIIEPYFNYINKKYCRLMDNFNGYNSVSGSKNQPNDEYMNKIKKNFPDQKGCYNQLVYIIEQERLSKKEDYVQSFNDIIDSETPMTLENYLLVCGSTTGYKNRLNPNGINITINGDKLTYDCFEIEFRKLSAIEWTVKFDLNDLTKVLAISDDQKHRFLLEQKHVQPMAITDRQDGDFEQFMKIQEYNTEVISYITEEREKNANTITELLGENPQLNDTLAKHLLTDSNGQHKDQKSRQRLEHSGEKILKKHEIKKEKTQAFNWEDEVNQYNAKKININEYL